MVGDKMIDVEKLRSDLIDYFGTAMAGFPVAMMDLSKIEKATEDELITIARQNGFSLDKYLIIDNKGHQM